MQTSAKAYLMFEGRNNLQTIHDIQNMFTELLDPTYLESKSEASTESNDLFKSFTFHHRAVASSEETKNSFKEFLTTFWSNEFLFGLHHGQDLD